MENSDLPTIDPWHTMELSTESRFELERHCRMLDEITDADTLRNFCKLFLQSWSVEKAAAQWAIREAAQNLKSSIYKRE
jgi:hypothetical protein